MLPRQTNKTRISAGNHSDSSRSGVPLILAEQGADDPATACFMPLLEAAKLIGCRPLRLARAIRRNGLHDPIGKRFSRRRWYVYRFELEAPRLAMHRRLLVTP